MGHVGSALGLDSALEGFRDVGATQGGRVGKCVFFLKRFFGKKVFSTIKGWDDFLKIFILGFFIE